MVRDPADGKLTHGEQVQMKLRPCYVHRQIPVIILHNTEPLHVRSNPDSRFIS